MKKIKQITRISLLMIRLMFAFNELRSQTISTHFFGENAWMPDTIGNYTACAEPPCLLNGQLNKQWGNIKNSNASIIRFGGISADQNMPTNYQYIRIIDSIRANGMEPVIQVPFDNFRYTAQQAAAIVSYINVKMAEKIKYWIIANEPDQSYSYTSSAEIAKYFRPFASAMKKIDPSILIIGPEVAWFNQPILTGITTPNGPDDLTGKDSLGNYYLDIVSFHAYGFNGTQSRASVISQLTGVGSLQSNLALLNTQIASCNSAHNRTGAYAIKTAITEANIDFQNSSSDNLNGSGANSFIGGQYIAELLGIGMKNGVDFVNLWSVIEGNNTATSIGFIDPSTNNKKPEYYHFQLLAQNFSGNYVNGTTNIADIKSFGCQKGQQVCVLLLNEDQTNSYSYTLRLDTAGISGTDPLKINLKAGIAKQYSDELPSQSTVLLTFNAAGAIIKKCVYALAENASLNLAPTCTEFSPTSVAAITQPASNFGVNVYPNPSPGVFTVELNTANLENSEIKLDIINIVGQVVYSQNVSFINGKEVLNMQDKLADGVYMLRITNGKNIVTKEIVKRN